MPDHLGSLGQVLLEEGFIPMCEIGNLTAETRYGLRDLRAFRKRYKMEHIGHCVP